MYPRNVQISNPDPGQLQPSYEIEGRCQSIAHLPMHLDIERTPFDVLIGGAPWMMSRLEAAVRDAGFRPLYAFSARESTELVQAGSVRKMNVFRHVGFLEADPQGLRGTSEVSGHNRESLRTT